VVAELRRLAGHSSDRPSQVDLDGLAAILDGISIKRQLALEGLPTHKCASSIDDLQAGRLRYPDGTLTLPLKEGQIARKIGGDSTVQVDGHGAKPWILIRRLGESSAPGDLRARVRTDTVFNRRLKAPGAKFSAGYAPDSALPMVLWDYSNAAAEQVVVGVLKTGNELLTIEVVSTGLREGEARRKAREEALALLVAMTGDATQAPEMEPLIGWNVGTMGRDE
jgi:hypothetical protein